MKKVIFYTSAFFLDSALEVANCIKDSVKLTLCIEVSSYSKNATILNLDNINNLSLIEKPENVLNEIELKKFEPYFNGIDQVFFIIHRSKKSFSYSTISDAIKIAKFLNKLKPDVWHFDNVSLRSLGFYPFIKRLIINLHDPVAHTGEKDWRDVIKNKLFRQKANSFMFYSAYSAKLFSTTFPNQTKPISNISLQPYTFLKNLVVHEAQSRKEYILFFGRLSPYKGIDLLMQAIPKVLEKYPHTQFIIAGNPSYAFEIDQTFFSTYKNNIKYIKGYLPATEIAKLIHHAQFVVCPYREATQSGVLSSTNTLGKTVLCTNVGAFPESVKHNHNGLLCEPNAVSIANGLLQMLQNDYYLQLEKQVETTSSQQTKMTIKNTILQAYETTCM